MDLTVTRDGHVTSPAGFSAAAVTAGIKPSGNPDMALVVNTVGSAAAALFTRNKVVAAPVKVTRAAVADGTLRAVVYTSGNANACNGVAGDRDAEEIQSRAAAALELEPAEGGVCSTGLIGEPLPMAEVRSGVDALAAGLGADAEHGAAAAGAILTTDTCSKEVLVSGDGWSVGGMAKGVGMMAPSLATMLVCLTTDADVPAARLDAALRAAAEVTFDTLDVDGSTSTNDTVVAMASGASGITPDAETFDAAVLAACRDLAAQLQADAEGVTKRVAITVTGAVDDDQARTAARVIGRDNLFKCAMFGSDPNWGRVLAAVGMAPVEMDPDHITVTFNGTPVCVDSAGAPGARDVDLSGADIDVQVDLGLGGHGHGTVRTTDLSHAYVEINSAYSS